MSVKIPLLLVRAAGVLALVLGAGYFLGWPVPLHAHMGAGALMVLGLGLLALLGWRLAPPLALAGLAVALAVPVVGLGQLHWGLGESRWLLQVVHVVIALGGFGLAETLARRLKETAVAV